MPTPAEPKLSFAGCAWANATSCASEAMPVFGCITTTIDMSATMEIGANALSGSNGIDL